MIVAFVLAVAILYPGRAGLLVLAVALAVAGLLIYVGQLRFRRIAEAAQLHRTAERIAELFKVPYVVFGHSHAAGTWRLSSGGEYVNVGTWVPAGEDAYFVYFMLDAGKELPEGRLWRWNKRAKIPGPLRAESAGQR
jgi:hypothetical protein